MDDITRNLRQVNPDDINPRYKWDRHLPALGTICLLYTSPSPRDS